jgi:pimeloyl-ACP methyl ester carboxylesterase
MSVARSAIRSGSTKAHPAPSRAGRASGARSRLRRLGVPLAASLTFAALGATGAAPALGAGIVQLPVAFQVKNTNTSQAPCTSGLPDGAMYTIRGHISGPATALRAGAGRAITPVTLYLFGYEAGEWNWDLKGVAGYDYAAEMASRGHVSLTIDELGYGASGHPANGNETCQGAEADVAHQIVQALRSGAYSLGTGRGIAFSRVLLAGHDIGGSVAEIEAYSYADIDGLISVTFAHQGFTPYIIERSTVAAFGTCTESPSGYAHFISEDEFRSLLFYNTAPRVIDAAAALRNPNPCGVIRSNPPSVLVADRLHIAEIKVPVLIVFGDNDTLVWSRQGEEEEQRNFSGSPDASTVFIPEAGHFPMFSRTASVFDREMSAWLGSRFPAP